MQMQMPAPQAAPARRHSARPGLPGSWSVQLRGQQQRLTSRGSRRSRIQVTSSVRQRLGGVARWRCKPRSLWMLWQTQRESTPPRSITTRIGRRTARVACRLHSSNRRPVVRPALSPLSQAMRRPLEAVAVPARDRSLCAGLFVAHRPEANRTAALPGTQTGQIRCPSCFFRQFMTDVSTWSADFPSVS